jgi:hypothetical protein
MGRFLLFTKFVMQSMTLENNQAGRAGDQLLDRAFMWPVDDNKPAARYTVTLVWSGHLSQSCSYPAVIKSYTTGKAGGLKAPEPLKAAEKQEPPKGDC